MMRPMNFPKGILLVLLGAAVLTLSLPNELFSYGNPALGLVALVPLYLALSMTPGRKRVGALVALFGFAAHCLSSYWLWFFKDFAFWTLGSSALAYALVYFILGIWISWGMDKAGMLRPLVFALGWTVFEFLKSSGFLGYPWGLVAYSWNTVDAFNQVAELTGVYGMTFILALANAAVAEWIVALGKSNPLPRRPVPACRAAALAAALFPAWDRDPRANRSVLIRVSAVVVALFAANLAFGALRLVQGVPVAGTISAVLVQQNSDSWASTEQQVLRSCIRLTEDAIGRAGRAPDIVVWNESNLDYPYSDFKRRYLTYPEGRPLVKFIRETGRPFLLGAPIVLDYENFKATNSAILVSPDGDEISNYAKRHPVPFAEAIPFMEYAWFRNFMEKVVGLASGWEMGTDATLFYLDAGGKTWKFGTPICFEDAFADICRDFYAEGADLLINLSNVTWSKTESAEIQHFVAARYRAIEHRRTLVQSTNGGVTCVVDAHGRIRESLPLFVPASIFVDIPVYAPASPTLYALRGDWFAFSCLGLCVALAAFFFVTEIASRHCARALPRLSFKARGGNE